MSGADFAARAIALGGFAKLASTDAGSGGELVGYRSSSPQGAERTVSEKLDDWVSVKDFGAKGDGVTDDTAAIRAALAALVSRSDLFYGYRMGTGCLYFPEGVYRVTENAVLTDPIYFHRSSLVLKGAGWRNSIIWLDPSALSGEAWFYDNGLNNNQWGMVCEDLCFSGGTTWYDADPPTNVNIGASNIDTKCNGFKISGPGWESGFVFTRCEFRYLQTVYHAAGSNNADTHRFIACAVKKCRNVNYINNLQAFSINWTGCYIDQIFGNFLEYGPNCSGGGGNFLMQGGVIIALQESGDTSPHYVVRATAGGTSLSNAPITFSDVRLELRGNYHAFAYVNYGSTMVIARGCSFFNTGSANKTLVTVGGYTTVRFEYSSFDNGTGGGKFTYQIGEASDGQRGKNAHLHFANGCLVDQALFYFGASTVSWAGNGGRLTIDENCSTADVLDSTSGARTYARGCDVFGPTSVTGSGLAVNTKHRTRKRYTINPFFSSAQLVGSPGLAGTSVQLPPLVRIVEVWAKIEPGQGNANNIRIRIGNDDKSVVYAESTVGPQNAGQFVVARDLYIPVELDINKSRVRFWFDNGSGGNSTASATGRIDGGVVYE